MLSLNLVSELVCGMYVPKMAARSTFESATSPASLVLRCVTTYEYTLATKLLQDGRRRGWTG